MGRLKQNGKGTKREVVECLLARYRNEVWFQGSRFERDSPEVELRVSEHCPFRTHRPMLGYPVRVVVLAPARPLPPLSPPSAPQLKKRVVRLAKPPFCGDVAGAVARIRAERRRRTA